MQKTILMTLKFLFQPPIIFIVIFLVAIIYLTPFSKILQHSNDRFNVVLNRCCCQSFFHIKGILYWIAVVSIKTQGLFVAVCNNGGPNLPVRSAIQANCYLKSNYQERIWSSMFKWTTKFTWYGLPLTQTATKFCFGSMADPTVHSLNSSLWQTLFQGSILCNQQKISKNPWPWSNTLLVLDAFDFSSSYAKNL